MGSRALRAAALFACALAGSCGGGRPPAPASAPAPDWFLEVDGGNLSAIEPTRIGSENIVLAVEPGVKFRMTSQSSSAGNHVLERTINGLPFELDGLTIRIGARSYGPFQKGDEVSLRPEGVFVGDRSFGALPES